MENCRDVGSQLGVIQITSMTATTFPFAGKANEVSGLAIYWAWGFEPECSIWTRWPKRC